MSGTRWTGRTLPSLAAHFVVTTTWQHLRLQSVHYLLVASPASIPAYGPERNHADRGRCQGLGWWVVRAAVGLPMSCNERWSLFGSSVLTRSVPPHKLPVPAIIRTPTDWLPIYTPSRGGRRIDWWSYGMAHRSDLNTGTDGPFSFGTMFRLLADH